METFHGRSGGLVPSQLDVIITRPFNSITIKIDDIGNNWWQFNWISDWFHDGRRPDESGAPALLNFNIFNCHFSSWKLKIDPNQFVTYFWR